MNSDSAHSSGQMPATTGHLYDGIQEYDNPLPAWWSWLFIGTIAFSVLYFPFYHMGARNRTLADGYALAQAENARLAFAEIGNLQPDEPTILRYMHKPEWVSYGKAVFATNCTSCHGLQGGGLVGPNLTDDEYKNVKSVSDIARIVSEGAAAGAMPAWKTRLQVNDIVLVSSYVASLRGGDPGPSPKRAEGEKIPPWPAPPPEEAPSAPVDNAGEVKEATGGVNDATGQADASVTDS